MFWNVFRLFFNRKVSLTRRLSPRGTVSIYMENCYFLEGFHVTFDKHIVYKNKSSKMRGHEFIEWNDIIFHKTTVYK